MLSCELIQLIAEKVQMGENILTNPHHTHTDEVNDIPVSADIVLSMSMQTMWLSAESQGMK